MNANEIISPEKLRKSGRGGRKRLRQKKRGQMNGLEVYVSQYLDFRRLIGEVKAWTYESVTLRLPGGVEYTPDFVAILKDGSTLVIEAKGHAEDDAIVKLKLAAGCFPWNFRLAWQVDGMLRFEDVQGD